jgi:hypothetical protein
MTSHPVHWRKSSRSINSTGCVELASDGERVLMRDSKHPGNGQLTFRPAEVAAFIEAVKAGKLDDLLAGDA